MLMADLEFGSHTFKSKAICGEPKVKLGEMQNADYFQQLRDSYHFQRRCDVQRGHAPCPANFTTDAERNKNLNERCEPNVRGKAHEMR